MDGTATPSRRQRVRRAPAARRILRSAALLAALAGVGPGGGPAAAQEAPPPADAFHDAPARALVQRARAARTRDTEGLRSYEGLLRERVYVGITSFAFRRERGLFDQERVARIRWSADGERAVQWIGARRAVPIVGADTRDAALQNAEAAAAAGNDPDAADPERAVGSALAEDLPFELLGSVDIPAFAFEPNGDRLAFGDDWALHPLADSALASYRYASGDTLRLTLPDRELVLYEVKVEPRRAAFDLVAGSLWFEAETASLVRATYRPARPFDLSLDDPEEADEVPGFLRPVEAEIEYVTVEYSLHESRFWLPRRFALEGEARLGSWVEIPLTVEWSVRDYTVNEDATELPLRGPLPRGWSRSERRVENADGSVRYVTAIVPGADALLTSAELTDDADPGSPSGFSDAEIDELKRELDALLPAFSGARPRLFWGLERDLLRYNRVEGLSVGTGAALPLSPGTRLEAEVRYGTGNEEVHGSLSALFGSAHRGWRVGAYRRLESMNELDDPFSLPSSVTAFVLGTDRGEYFRATGVEAGLYRTGRNSRWEAVVFREKEDPVTLGSTFYLTEFLRDDTVAAVQAADEVDATGVRGVLRWFAGTDPDALILSGTLRGEVASGNVDYRRLAATVAVGHPLPLGLAGALEVGGGTTWTGAEPLPIQRRFYLGGAHSLRGFNANEVIGDSFWLARGEVATGFAGARLVLFGDMAWAGARGDVAWADTRASVGGGVSLLDGLLRADLARAVRGESRWKIHIYLDGLF